MWKSKQIQNIFESLSQHKQKWSVGNKKLQKDHEWQYPVVQIEKTSLFLIFDGAYQWNIYIREPHLQLIGFIHGNRHLKSKDFENIFQRAFESNNQSLFQEYTKAIAGLGDRIEGFTTITYASWRSSPHLHIHTINASCPFIDIVPDEYHKIHNVLTQTAYCSDLGLIGIGGMLAIDIPTTNHQRLQTFETTKTLLPSTLLNVQNMDKSMLQDARIWEW